MKPIRFALFALVVCNLVGCDSNGCRQDIDCEIFEFCVGGQCTPRGEIVPIDTTSSPDTNAEQLTCKEPSVGELTLNEILANPGDSDSNGDGVNDPYTDEFIEVVNVTEQPLNLTGLAIVVGGRPRYTFAPRCLNGGASIVVFGGPVTTAAPGGSHYVAASSRLHLTNDGNKVQLIDHQGKQLSAHTYQGHTQSGRSHSRTPDGRGSWTPHPILEGTPAISPGRCVNLGLFPECAPPAVTRHDDRLLDRMYDCPPIGKGELIINEVMADPGLTDTNGDGILSTADDEFIELVLPTDSARSTHNVAIHVGGEHRFQFPELCLSPGSVVVIFGGGIPERASRSNQVFLASPKPLRLPNSGGQVSLHIDSALDSDVIWGPEGGKDQSLTRHPDLHGSWTQHSSISPFNASPGWCSDGTAMEISGCTPSFESGTSDADL